MDEVANFLDLSVEDQRTAIVGLAAKRNLSAGRVFLTLPRDRGIVRQVEFPAAIRDTLKSAVSLQIEALSPWPLDEIYWDFAYREGSKASKCIVTVVIIPRQNVEPWIDLFRAAKLPLTGVSLSPASLAHGVEVLWTADNRPTIVLDAEESYVDGVLLSSGSLSSVRQPGKESATAKTAVAQLISLGRVQSPEDARLIVYGAAAESVEGLEDVPVPLENAGGASRQFGAVASALSSVKSGGFNCNVLPPDVRFRRSQLRLVPTYALVLVALGLAAGLGLREPYQYSRYAASLDGEIRGVAPQARQVSAQAAELDRLALKYRALLSTFQQNDYTLESLQQLATSLPPTAWLTSFTYQDGSVMISGTAVSASEVQKILEETALFKDVQFTSSVAREPDGRERFSLKAAIEVSK
jgi:Tfp pilus assembly protein PilN